MKINYKIKNGIILVTIAIFTLIAVRAQSQSLEIGAFGGGAYILNDYERAIPFKNNGYTVGAIARLNLNTRWAFRLSYNYGNINYYNSDNQTTPFTSVINDVSLIAEFNFSEYKTGGKNSTFSPYLFGGLSGFAYDSISNNVKFSSALTFGVGVKYSLTKKIGIGFEWGMRKTLTDDLDGDDRDSNLFYGTDWYNFTGITLTYKLDIFNSKKCKN